MKKPLIYAAILVAIAIGLGVVLQRSQADSASTKSQHEEPAANLEGPHASIRGNAPSNLSQNSKVSSENSKSAESVDRLTETFRAISTDELKEKLDSVKQRINDEEWIERANNGSLTADARGEFEEILNTETAAQIVLLERDIARIKGKYL